MPSMSYKARLYNRQDEIDIPLNISSRDYNILQSRSSGITQEHSRLLKYYSDQASPKLIVKEKLRCFRCDKPALTSVSTPGLRPDSSDIHDMMYIPICNDRMCEAEGHRLTQQTLEEFAKLQKRPDKKNFQKAWGTHCAFCGRVEDKGGPKMQFCSRCKCMYYCSRDCQAKHWKAGHKKTCKPLDEPIMVKKAS